MANFLDSIAKAAAGTLMKPIDLFQRNLKKNLFMKSRVVTAIKASMKGFMATLKKPPAKRGDYVTIGNRMYAKRLLMVLFLFGVFMMVIGNSLLMPLVRGRLYTPTIALSDPLLATYSGKANLINREKVLIYEGVVANGKCNGYGKLYDDKGRLVYVGEFKEDTYEGQGMLYDTEGHKIYEGQFKGNFFEGTGKGFDTAGRLTYSGEYVQGLKNGYGLAYYENGNVQYAGGFQNNKYQGDGTLYALNGDRVYSGGFVNGLFEGNGKSFYDKEVLAYEGFFSLGQFSGLGRQFDPSGRLIYEGNFLQGLYNGMGKKFNPANQALLYEGSFEFGKPSGEGALYNAGMKIYEGPWLTGLMPMETLLGKLSTDLKPQFPEAGQIVEMDAVYGLYLKKTGLAFELNYPAEALEPMIQKIIVQNMRFIQFEDQPISKAQIIEQNGLTDPKELSISLTKLPDSQVYKLLTNEKQVKALVVKREGFLIRYLFRESDGALLLYEYEPVQE